MMILASSLVFLAFFSVGGALREAADDEFPFQVTIQNQDSRHLCGGAIITPKWVLTVSSCLIKQSVVRVGYGSADSNNPKGIINSQRIEHQNELNLLKKNRLALIELQSPIEFSQTVKKASLPTFKAQIRNNTKLCGWKVLPGVNVRPNLYVSDTYYVIPKDCRTSSGTPVALDVDEFCGLDENQENLYNLGTIVSKSAIVLGIMAESPLSAVQPIIFVKLSEHEDWIKDVLKSDAKDVNWVNDIPKDSAPSQSATSLVLMGISAILLLRFV